jgi:hypothetical protein
MAVLLLATVGKSEVGALDALTSLLSRWKLRNNVDVLFLADDGLTGRAATASRICAEFKSLSDVEAFMSELWFAGEEYFGSVHFEVLHKLKTPDIDALGTLL